ncbi:glycosyl hydrolase [Streptomyces sp. G-G2]|uniref:glycoside hydrolase family 26 protein n=1 Tax=Streptomyces sp. G-G2 TaxID=3046201 RepID=UPI0024BA1C22|nr:glycosyl hydrolase [Streptomyces sp. G-G2]MDJ0380510.1 glycosyl hydrolase [Streptomyces sp. G-G2]
MSRPHRRLVSTCVGTVTAGLLATGAALAAPGEEPAGSGIAMGAYLDYGPSGVARIPLLSRWLGGREIRVGHTYLPGDRWSNIEGTDFLADWAEWRQARSNRMFVLNVPMQERNESRIPDHQVARLIRAGADGQNDAHFKKLAERLVSLGVPDTVIVLGWEMNGTTYTHRCGPDPERWKVYWKRVVTAMRSVPGQRFKFDYAPNRGTDAIGWTRCYPGDDVVDIVGMDSYDQGPGSTFDDQVSQPYGLQKHVDFAKAHGKEISYPEWGLFRHGDNPEYVRRMIQWIEEHKPAYHTITDYCPHGVWQCKQNPRSSKAFRDALSAKPDPLPTPVVPTPVIPTPVVPTPVIPTPVVPTPVVPTPQVPTPQVPTPQVPSPAVPTPVLPTPVLPSPVLPSPVVPTPVVPSPEIPAPETVPTPVAPSPVVPSPVVPSAPQPSPAVPSPVAPSPVVPSPVEVPVPGSPSPAPVPAPVPTPLKPPVVAPKPPSVPSQWCVPLNFGEWLSKIVGKQAICFKIDLGEDSTWWPF